MLNKWLNKAERKFGRFAIPHLMSVILVGMIVIYCFDFLMQSNPNISEEMRMTGAVSSLFNFDLAQIKAGQIWRVISFVFLPPSTGILFAVFAFYFIWLIGMALEAQWGSFKFNVYYLLGVIGTMIVGLATGSATNTYLNLTLLLAFAILFPDFEVLLFFFIPVKIKWIALLDAAGLLIVFLLGDFHTRLLLLCSVINLVIFFGKDAYDRVYYAIRRKYHQHKNKK